MINTYIAFDMHALYLLEQNRISDPLFLSITCNLHAFKRVNFFIQSPMIFGFLKKHGHELIIHVNFCCNNRWRLEKILYLIY